MRKLYKSNEPEELRVFRDGLGRLPCSADWKKPMPPRAVKASVKRVLESDQKKLCCYCEENVGGTGHVEHISPRDVYPEKTLDWNNLALSCSHKDSCGHLKGSDNGDLVDPYTHDCFLFFSYYFNGEVCVSPGLNVHDRKMAERSLSVLGLKNSSRLRRRRNSVIDIVMEGFGDLLNDPDIIGDDDLVEELVESIFVVRGLPFRSAIVDVFDLPNKFVN